LPGAVFEHYHRAMTDEEEAEAAVAAHRLLLRRHLDAGRILRGAAVAATAWAVMSGSSCARPNGGAPAPAHVTASTGTGGAAAPSTWRIMGPMGHCATVADCVINFDCSQCGFCSGPPELVDRTIRDRTEADCRAQHPERFGHPWPTDGGPPPPTLSCSPC